MRERLWHCMNRGLRHSCGCVLLALLMALTTGFSQPAVFGAVPQTFYKLVTGVIFLWGPGDSAAGWDPAAPGGVYTVNTSDQLRSGATNVKIFWYVPEQFDLEKMPNVEGPKDADQYHQRYGCYGAQGQSTVLKQGPDPSGRISYSYTFRLESEKEFPVERLLSSAEGISEIRGLIGNYAGSLDKYLHQQKIGQNVSCRMFFLPYIIQYDWAPETDDVEQPAPFPIPDDGKERTFSLSANLTGTQKQNRKQVLNLRVDLPQGRKLSELKVTLADPTAKETAQLVWKGAGARLANTTQIKTRPVTLVTGEPVGSTARSVDYKLEFLTKNSEPQEFQFTAQAVDDRGAQTETSGTFTVRPDRAPQAKIELEDSYLRAPNSNRAEIRAEDRSQSDGDQLQRTWTVSLTSGAAFTAPDLLHDLSFGAGKLIEFAKEGVGPFQVRLQVRDVWTEETLSEYVTSADYLSDMAEASSQVINTAPVVRLGQGRDQAVFRSGELLLLAANQQELQLFSRLKSKVKALLVEAGIESEIRVTSIKLESKANAAGEPAFPLLSAKFTEPFGHLGEKTFLEQKAFLVDDENLYTVQGTWYGGGAEDLPKSPYVITARLGETGRSLWSYPVFDDVMPVAPNAESTGLCQDDSGRFLFFRSGKKTAVLSKENGAFQAVLPVSMGDSNFVEKDQIYTVKDDGVCRINLETGAVSTIFKGKPTGKAQRIGNRVHFVVKEKDGGEASRAILDLKTGEVTRQPLPGIDGTAEVKTLDVDSDGKLVLSYQVAGKLNAVVFDSANRLKKALSLDRTEANQMTITPVCGRDGQCRYLAATWREQDAKGGFHSYAWLYGIDDDFSAGTQVMSARAFQTASNRILLARENSGMVYLATGGDWGRKPGTNELKAEYGMLEKAQAYGFDLSKGTAELMDIADLEGDISCEYGISSDTMTVFHCADNALGNAVEQGSKYRILSWPGDPDATLFRQVRKYGNNRSQVRGVAASAQVLEAALVSGGLAEKLLKAFGLEVASLNSDAISAKKSEENMAEAIVKKILKSEEGTGIDTQSPARNYEKGQPVDYGVLYTDRENDPSKEQFWRYAHIPQSEGVLAEAGRILPAPIPTFQKNGVYTVEHWQTDRTENTAYDRTSQKAAMTFSVGTGGHPPKVTGIGTSPVKIKKGDWYQIRAGVWDQDGDQLSLLTEVFLGERKIFSHVKTDLKPDKNGVYPQVSTGTVSLPAAPGAYRVACTVKDQTGSGKGTWEFAVVTKPQVNGWVNHTQQWDQNRKKYNLKRFKDEINRAMTIDAYQKMKPPRKRGTNVFWSGEEFRLNAELSGDPIRVTCGISGTNYRTTLSDTGKKTATDDRVYTGSLWQESMVNRWGRKQPQQLVFHFTAEYLIGDRREEISRDVSVIVDSKEDFWQLKRLW